jgi:hypothetical protein
MLEKARMKGKKGLPLNVSVKVHNDAGDGKEEYEDDGLCCTCGQQVGGHSHVPSAVNSGGGGGTTQASGGAAAADGGNTGQGQSAKRK